MTLATTSDSRPGAGQPAQRLERVDALLALALALTLYGLYRATFQDRQFGDGPLLLQLFTAKRDGSGHWGHVLYMPLAGALWSTSAWSNPVEVLRFLSSGTGAFGAACAYVLCRAFGAQRGAALVAALLLGLSPGWWFFATTLEVHSLHAACVGLCVLVTLCAPWHRPALASLCVAAVLPLLFLSHQSGLLLGLGFVFLAQFARARSGAPAFSLPVLLLVIGPLFLSSFCAAIAIAVELEETTAVRFFGASNNLIETFDRDFDFANVLDGWLIPLTAILPMALLSVVLRRVRGLRLITIAALLLPSMGFFLVWGLPERGGYALGSAAGLCAAAALLLPQRPARAWLVGGLLVLLQAGLSYGMLRRFDAPAYGEDLERRARSVARVIPGKGTLLSINPRFQYIEAALPDVSEKSFYLNLGEAYATGRTPAQFAAEVAPLVEAVLAGSTGVVAVDLSYRAQFEAHATHLLPYAEAFDASILSRYRLTPFDDSEWPMALIQ